MATTIALEIKKAPTGQGRFPIYIRITKDRRHKRIKTSVELNRLADWNPKGSKNSTWVRTSEKHAAAWNAALEKELEEARALYRDNKKDSIDTLVEKMKHQGTSDSFLFYAKEITSELAAQGRTNAKHYKSFCVKLDGFLSSQGKKDLAFSDLTPALLAEFESYLNKEHNEHTKEEKRLHPNYVRALLVKFRALVNRAIREGLFPLDKYPFRNHPLPKELGTGREALDESEVAAIVALEYPAGSLLWHTKNAFLFSFYCAGIRVGDLLQLRWRNIQDEGERLEYVMGKNHKQRNYQLVPQAKQILALYRVEGSKPSDYIFPFLDGRADYAKSTEIDTMPVDLRGVLFRQIYSKNAILNKYLKKVAQDAGIAKIISFHISRHTFASIARKKAVPSKVVQEALAHSSLSTTERYLHSFSAEEVGSALEKVFSSDKKQDALLDALRDLKPEELRTLLGRLQGEGGK